MNWNKNWKSSVKPKKQRKYVFKAPAHTRNQLPCSHLSKELRTKLKMRSIRVRKGDKVKVLRGQFKGKIGTIEKVDNTKIKVHITGVETIKKDGSKAKYPINPSNIIIQEVDTTDKRRLGEKK